MFKYKSGKHNVLRVNETEFQNCTVPKRPLATNKDPDIPVTLAEEGDYFFIDGLKDYCAAGNMKLSVQVGPAASPPGGWVSELCNSCSSICKFALQLSLLLESMNGPWSF